VRGDYLSRLLAGREIGLAAMLAGLCVAFGLGAAHALSPGHGKTIVAAYLVGSRGTFRHALLLGVTVTFTHTASVFGLGLAVLLAQRYVLPERIVPVLGAISGISIVLVAASLLRKRIRALRHVHHHHHHHHHHHDVPEKVTPAGLIALGVSGGLVPCPSALVLLLSAVALGRVALGLALLAAFSLGLASVLTAIGALVLYARNLLPERSRFSSGALRYVPVVSAAVVMALGIAITGMSLGWRVGN
jgi:ABC-type nickel/cobalt efflux system permease component RcnA